MLEYGVNCFYMIYFCCHLMKQFFFSFLSIHILYSVLSISHLYFLSSLPCSFLYTLGVCLSLDLHLRSISRHFCRVALLQFLPLLLCDFFFLLILFFFHVLSVQWPGIHKNFSADFLSFPWTLLLYIVFWSSCVFSWYTNVKF